MAESNCEGELKHLQLEVTATQNIVPHTDSLDATPTTDRKMMSDTPKSDMKLDPSEYMEVSWDTTRCLYLLWKIDIAFGDVSLANIIREEIGALYDFDLATEVKLTCRSPGRKGWERTGTLPFMALDLLRFYDGQIKRRFRHDLESGTWCLAWQMVIEESEHWYWYTGALDDIHNHKRVLAVNFERTIVQDEWETYYEFIDNWLLEWSRIYREMNSRTKVLDSPTEKFKVREKYNEEHPDEELIRTAVDLARKCGLDNVDALSDTFWMDSDVRS